MSSWPLTTARPSASVLHAAKRGTRFEALEPLRQGVRERFGGIGDGAARGLRLRHDHGSNYLAADFQQEIAFFGIESSPSFVREPEGNGVAERFIRTLKENLLWVRSFETIEDLRLALLAFKRDVQRTMDARENTHTEAPRRCDATSSGWTRPRRCEYRQTTVQEPWGATELHTRVGVRRKDRLLPRPDLADVYFVNVGIDLESREIDDGDERRCVQPGSHSFALLCRYGTDDTWNWRSDDGVRELRFGDGERRPCPLCLLFSLRSRLRVVRPDEIKGTARRLKLRLRDEQALFRPIQVLLRNQALCEEASSRASSV